MMNDININIQGKSFPETPIKNMKELTAEIAEANLKSTEAKELAEVNTEIVADKDYDTAKFSGMGRVNLQKNIVDGHNYLTQEMVSKPNTIYKVQYDYEIAPVTTGYIAELNQGTIEVEGHTFNYKVIAVNAGDIITKESGMGNTTAILYMTSDNVWHNPHTPTLTVKDGWTIAIADVVGGSTAVNYNVTTKSITVPENCVLEFEGGSISGGSININGAYVLPSFNSLGNINVEGIPAIGTLFYNGGLLNISNGTKWLESDGASAGVQRAGLITKRPALTDIYAGFMYLVTQPWEDATLDTDGPAGPYYFDGSNSWILADGTTKQDGQMPARS